MSDNAGNVASAGIATVTTTTDAGQSLTVQSNHSTQAELEQIHKPAKEEKEPKNVNEAASEFGRKGGEASAKARAAVKRAEAKQAKEAEQEEAEEPEEKSNAEPARAARTRDAGETDSADDQEASGEADGESSAKPLGKPRDDPRARVAQVTRQHAELKRAHEAEKQRAADLERRLAEYERRTALAREEPRQVDQGEPQPPDGPQIEDYKDFQSWLDARDDYRDKVKEARSRAAFQHHAYQGHLHSEKSQMRDALIKSFGDADSVHETLSAEVLALKPTLFLREGESRDGRTFIADEIYSDKERAKDFLLYFTEHPDDFQRIAALRTPREVTRAMAKLPIDAATAGASVKGPQVSKAKPPIEPVSGGPHVAEGDAYKGESQSLEDYASRWNRQVRPKLRR